VSGPSDELSDAPGLHDLQLNARAAAVFLWLIAWGGAIGAAFYPQLPDPLVNGFFAAAIAATLSAVALRLAYARQAAAVAEHEAVMAEISRTQAAMTEALGELAERLGATDDVPDGFAAQVYKLGSELAARLQRAARSGGRQLEQSEYYQVYTDVLLDLCGIKPDDDGEQSEPTPS